MKTNQETRLTDSGNTRPLFVRRRQPAEESYLAKELGKRGFRKAKNFSTYRDKRFQLELGDWVSITTLKQKDGDPLTDSLGRPGFWRPGIMNGGYLQTFEFPVPPKLFQGLHEELENEGADSAGELDALLLLVDWATKTARGRRQKNWSPPLQEEVESWLPGDGLTVQSGEHLTRGKIIRTPGRLAFVFDRFGDTEKLPLSRDPWIRETLLGALDSWRVVRIGLNSRGSAQVELDLSGAPIEHLESLVNSTFPIVRWVVQWLLAPISLLTDRRLECACLDEDPMSVRQTNN